MYLWHIHHLCVYPLRHFSTDRFAGQSKLTFLVHKGFGQALAFYQYWEWVSTIILLVDFPNLHCIICQVVMDDVRPILTKHAVSVIPCSIEAKDLGWRKKSQRKQLWIRITNALSKRSGLKEVGWLEAFQQSSLPGTEEPSLCTVGTGMNGLLVMPQK